MSATLAAATASSGLCNIGDDRNVVGVLHRLEDLQPFVEAGATEGMNGGAVGLVVRRLEH